MVSLSNHPTPSFDKLRMSGERKSLMVSLSNHPTPSFDKLRMNRLFT